MAICTHFFMKREIIFEENEDTFSFLKLCVINVAFLGSVLLTKIRTLPRRVECENINLVFCLQKK